jgi:hypothetical protein
MNGKQLICMGLTFENTYTACTEQHCLRLFVALSANLGSLVENVDVVNAYDHAAAGGPTIFLIFDDVFQAWYTAHLGVDLTLGSCVPLLKAMQGHWEAEN